MRRIINGPRDLIGVVMFRYIGLAMLMILAFLSPVQSVKAQGNLIVNPRRIVFEGSRRLCELNVANSGKDTAVYAISLINIRMTKDGSFNIITKPDSTQRFANDFIRFFPKKVVLAPNEAQVVKVQLTQTSKLVPGEYRSHMYFRAVPQEQPLGKKTDDDQNSESISVKINAVFGISIPVIIRVGEPSVKVTLSDLSCTKVNDTTHILSLTFNREGNMSVYGNLHVDYVSPKGKTIEAGEVKGIAIYTPNTSRVFNVTLDRKHDIDYSRGKLNITYSTDIRNDKPVETELELK